MGGLGDNGNSQGPFLTLNCVFSLRTRKGTMECVIEEEEQRLSFFFNYWASGAISYYFLPRSGRKMRGSSLFPSPPCVSQSFFLYTDGMKPDRTRSSSFQFRIEENILNRKLPSEYTPC